MDSSQNSRQQIIIMEGDIVLFSHTRLFDRLVKWFTNSDYSHIGIIYSAGGKSIKVGEAWGTGFDIRKRRVEEIHACKVRRSKTQLKNVQKNLNKYIGSRYDKLNILGLILYKFIRLRVFETSAKNLTCSEASARFLFDSSLKKINFETEFNKPYDYITPADLALSDQLVDVISIEDS